jgi:hypothetical protein
MRITTTPIVAVGSAGVTPSRVIPAPGAAGIVLTQKAADVEACRQVGSVLALGRRLPRDDDEATEFFATTLGRR